MTATEGTAASLAVLRAAGRPMSIEAVARVLGVRREHVAVWVAMLNVGGAIVALHPRTTRRSRRTHAVYAPIAAVQP